MIAPPLQVHIQPHIVHLVALTLIHGTRQRIRESPRAAGDVLPRDPNPPLRPSFRQIDDDYATLFPLAPAPGDQVHAALVVRPAASLAKRPRSFQDGRCVDSAQQALVEGAQEAVLGLRWSASKLNREPDPPPVQLPIVEQLRARQRKDGNRRGQVFRARERRCGARLVVVLDEADQLRLITQIRREMQPDLLGEVVL